MSRVKILYAAQNSLSSRIQLERFLAATKDLPFIIKIAAFKKSSPINVNIDWTLDCLHNIFKPDHISLDNDNFQIYFDQIKGFSPDLIISDMEYFSSEIAISLGKELWQVSSSLINFAIPYDYKYNLGLFKKYAFLLNRKPIHTQRMVNIQVNSNLNLIYSHLGDYTTPPPIKETYQWIRPYFSVGKINKPCHHQAVGVMIKKNKQLLQALNNYSDVVCFTDMIEEGYSNILLKNLSNQDEYYCNIRNSDIFICNGEPNFLADGFYNNKFVVTLDPEPEDLATCFISEKLNLSSCQTAQSNEISYYLNDDIVFLHEKILEHYHL